MPGCDFNICYYHNGIYSAATQPLITELLTTKIKVQNAAQIKLAHIYVGTKSGRAVVQYVSYYPTVYNYNHPMTKKIRLW